MTRFSIQHYEKIATISCSVLKGLDKARDNGIVCNSIESFEKTGFMIDHLPCLSFSAFRNSRLFLKISFIYKYIKIIFFKIYF